MKENKRKRWEKAVLPEGEAKMGFYLNSRAPYVLYEGETKSRYFVDKTLMLEKIFGFIHTKNTHVCITRPRRFGKTVMANMLGAFLGKRSDAKELFDGLKIAGTEEYLEHLNRYNVIFIDFSKMDVFCKNYEEYIESIRELFEEDMQEYYPQIQFRENESIQGMLLRVFQKTGERFVFIMDEWDSIFHKSFMSEDDQKKHIWFLSNLLKDQPYVILSYMTGILPISKYSEGSELNMFREYTLVTEETFSEEFGFVEDEVDRVYAKYLTSTVNPKITRDDLRRWYDGYYTKSGERIYNPRSVVLALSNNNLGNYWTNSGPYDEIYYYVKHDIDGVRDDLALMAAGESVPANVQEYSATSMNLTNKDEIFSAMVVYGLLSYYEGEVCIPNKELLDKYNIMLAKEPGMGYVYRLAKESRKMLNATLHGDTKTMSDILEYVHNTEIPILSYNHETELAAIVNLVFLAARDWYQVEREDKAGKGFVDFICYPYNRNATCLILELKVDDTAESALRQIKEKGYALRFQGKLGEEKVYTGDILAVGIGYWKDSKKHECKIEKLSTDFG
ncbi:AAA family ATPase [Dorea sp.]